jgi:hypothetical protein
VGSEKVGYLTDPWVVAALKKHGLDLQVEKAGRHLPQRLGRVREVPTVARAPRATDGAERPLVRLSTGRSGNIRP